MLVPFVCGRAHHWRSQTEIQVRRKWSLLRKHMTNSFLSDGKGWDFGVTNVHLLPLSGASLAYRFQSRGPSLSTTP